MGWRNIFITSSTKLSTKDNGLLVTKNGGEINIPLEDISSIILDNKSIVITSRVLEEIASRDIVLLTNDDKHLPNGIFQGYGRHSRQLAVIKAQLDMSIPHKKRLWQEVVIKKLENQGRVLQLLGCVGNKHLLDLSKQVRSGDEDNLEAVGAKYYFQKLFGDSFTRRDHDIRNFALNYGYAIIRGRIARTLTSHGYICSLGIHHRNEYNAFNLADDIIEPYRPVIDLWVASNLDKLSEELSTENKVALVEILNVDVKLLGKKYSVNISIEEVIKRYTKCVIGKLKNLPLPSILPIQEHRYV
ncbi:type II CRISPR-associated endonuclease Cas1 [uncultured Ilyobacter sp.]|uniref:type II CRISPR-associated endonuclease Cas1 n=1 Tax=uncultured Ilyobacter sp. TaxID=544433 RepID=UPI0029F496A3|nr:type II CRISPR-associated endonuclease Cas1 [uncultured Ilyobacter sp.]